MRVIIPFSLRHTAWLALGLIACAPGANFRPEASNGRDIFINNFDQLSRIPIGSRISFRGHFQEGHEVSGVYINYHDYSDINSRCLSISDPPSYRGYLNGQGYLVRGTLVENSCSTGGRICRNACNTYKINIDTVSHR